MDNKYLFIGGLHRSGTTLLGRLLDQHPEISSLGNTGVIEDEGQFLQSVYATDMAHGGPGRFAFDDAAHLTEESQLVSRDSRDRLYAAWQPYWDTGRRVLLEKSPPNLLRGRFLQAVFPQSHFLFILRHPVATSLATHKWSGTGIHSLLHHWVHAHTIMRVDNTLLDRVKVISYERLVAAPQQVLREIDTFLGLDPFDYKVNLDPSINARYYDRWRAVFFTSGSRVRPVPSMRSFYGTGNRIRDFNPGRALKKMVRMRLFGEQRQMSHALYEAQDAVCLFENKVNSFGYSLTDFTRNPEY